MHYRNKVQSVFRMTKQKRLISGIYQSERQGIVAVDKCMTEDSDASKIVVTIRQIMEKYRIKPYDSRTDTGFLKHVLIRKGKATGQIMVVLVASTMIFPSQGKFLNRLLAAHPQITTVVLNENPHPTKLLLGKQEKVLYGDGVIYDTLCGYRFKISPRSFYQINHDQTERLYEKAIELAELTGTERIIDAYCGIGTIGLIASRHCKEVIAVESNRQAVQDAKENSKLNGVTNCSFYTADAGEFMVELAEQGERVNVVFMDPPRAGSDRNFLSSLVKLSPQKIVYVSCNPDTQLRDARYLTKHGYQVQYCQPVDLFPFTNHVETVVLLSKGMVDSRKVKVDFSLEDMDLSEFKGKATYEQIKEYVLEETGLKVSSLYIAQIKKKCGLDVGENFNPAKSENARQPQCTPEKEDAIMQAFRHFGIV